MTARQVYEAMLVELNKTEAPSLLLEDFNYFFNKAINLYINRNYNIYDTNQLTTDDLRVLKSTATLKPVKMGTSNNNYYGVSSTNSLYSNVWETELPEDYMHILNCVCEYELQKRFKCYDKGTLWAQPATRLTSDMWSQIINNFYMRPSYRNPYYFIHNVNPVENYLTSYNDVEGDSFSTNTSPTNPYRNSGDTLHESKGTDPSVIVLKIGIDTADHTSAEKITLSGLSRIVNKIEGSEKEDLVEHYPGLRYGNHSPVRMEIRYGKDDSVFLLKKVYVDYLKTPLYIRLTQEQLDKTEDTSQIMEFPDYVCQEIINGLVTLILENASDQRLLTNLAVNQSIATGLQLQNSKS